MKIRLVAVFLGVLVISGCSADMHLYPVKGPLSAQTPLPVLNGKISGVDRIYGGDITLVLADGETATGHWTPVKRADSPDGKTSSIAITEGMPAAWETVYGQGFYSSHVLGHWLHGAGTVTGDHGTVLNVEFVNGEHEQSAKGVAKDNKDNVYKIVFY